MTKKIFRSILFVAVTVLLASLVIATSFLYEYFSRTQISQLKEELTFVSASLEKSGTDSLTRFASSTFRFTHIAADGSVLYDTRVAADSMENHLDREEVREAFADGEGSSARYSSTLTEKTLYEAVRLSDGTVLRVSVSQLTLTVLVLGMLPSIAVIVIIAIVVSMILADSMARRITDPINRLDLDNPLDNAVYDELSPILNKINKQHQQISAQMALLRQKADEFEQIISSMTEGIVLLDENGTLLSMNPAAGKIFGADEESLHHDFLTMDRSPQMSGAIGAALRGRHSEFRMQRGGGEYQVSINRIESQGKTLGAVILAFDVTEKAFAERNRQEFTANVSHELKTPLQSIVGSAELLENGLVKAEDTPRFVGHIKNEATRLVTLINDIIRLSQLDEQAAPARETVDLHAVAQEAAQVLHTAADKKRVTLAVVGEACTLSGVRRYLYEIVYNLCDNAIRYNVEGGSVTVKIVREGDAVVLTVSDSGIGIPPEHQPRIFERFYRVDKSHSKETGGTGLGLSIVKHAVQYHGGKLELDSAPDKGTTVTVTFTAE